MPYAAELHQVLERHAREIDDLRTIARLHGLPTGAPECLLALPLRLSKDSRLRSDLTELVRSLQTQDPDLGLPDVLSIVLAAVGGSAPLDRRRDLEEAVDLTGGFLASLGGWPGSAVEPTIDIDNPPDHDPRLDLSEAAETRTLEADLERPLVHQEEVTVTAPPVEISSETAKDISGAVNLAEITHALARLERGNLELRLHLDSIDQRICRMEPLLEAAPHSESLAPPLDPPRSYPLSPAPIPEPRDLLHRASSLPEAAPSRDRLDEVKAQRRISLTSNFLDPAVSSLPPIVPAGAPASPSRLTEPAVQTNPPGSTTDPLSHPRLQQPRRDRFAAAREIPGNSAETDPLYTGLDEEQEPASKSAVAVAPEPVAVVARASALEEPAFAPRIAAPLAATELEMKARPPIGPPVTTESRARLLDESVAAPTTASAAPILRSAQPLSSAMAEIAPPARSHAARWGIGAAATAVLGAAGFLYLNGLPSAVNDWFSGSSTAVASDSGIKSPANSDGSRPAAASASEAEPSEAAHSALPRHGAPSADVSARVLGARESFNPSTRIEKTEGPTFVPGGVMDGYLISAPRPAYPEMASLVGAQGKVTFEAMVSKEGQVEAVKVLGGSQVLRSAATDAVKQWQYRPFQVKGRPVEVRTIIRVDVASHAGSVATE